MANTRSMTFTPQEPLRDLPSALAPKRGKKAKEHPEPTKGSPFPEPYTNVVLCYGALLRDVVTVNEMLRTLLVEPEKYGGSCRVILSTLRQMLKATERLIEHGEDS